MTGNKIVCGSLQDFAKLCAEFQTLGLAFTGFTDTLTVVITGY